MKCFWCITLNFIWEWVIEDYQKNGNYNFVEQNQYKQGVKLTVVYNFGNQKVKKVRDIEGASDAIKSRTR